MDFARLSRAFILNTITGEQIPVMYNPEEIRLDQGNNFAEVGIPGRDAPPIQYVRGKGRSLSMELFFDTYESRQDVRLHTGRIVRLLDRVPQLNAPPILLFTMGPITLQCVLSEANQRFTMFARDGTPVRAILSARFQEYVRLDIQFERGVFAGPPTLHNMGQGHTMASVASAVLGDPSRWREIAEANDIDDPFSVPPGMQLKISQGPGR